MVQGVANAVSGGKRLRLIFMMSMILMNWREIISLRETMKSN